MYRLFVICFLFIFLACDNELYINDEWKDIPVVYGVLNSGTKEDLDGDGNAEINQDHFIRVQKSFLGSESAYSYADIHDSIYYDASIFN